MCSLYLSILLLLLNIFLISCEIKKSNYDNFFNKLEKFEIVYPKVLSKSEIEHRLKRSAEGKKINLNVWYISLNNLTIEARINDDVMVPESFESHWSKSGRRKVSDDDGLRLQKCFALYGSVSEFPGSSAVFTICEHEIFGLFTLGGVPYFIQPINDAQHVMYETKIPEKLSRMIKNGRIDLGDSKNDKSSAGEFLKMIELVSLQIFDHYS